MCGRLKNPCCLVKREMFVPFTQICVEDIVRLFNTHALKLLTQMLGFSGVGDDLVHI